MSYYLLPAAQSSLTRVARRSAPALSTYLVVGSYEFSLHTHVLSLHDYSMLLRLLSCLIFVGSLISSLAMAQAQVAPRRAVWLWDTPSIAHASNDLLKFAALKNVGTIYLQINMGVDDSVYQCFISAASSQNITVDALMGAPTWVLPAQERRVQDTLDWVTTYQNASRSGQRFAGIHFDIEPYLLPEWKTSQSTVVAGWQEVARKLVTTARLLNVPASADIPFWLHTIRTADSSGTLDRWMIQKCDSVTVMAYRNSCAGVLDIARTALMQGNAAGRPVWLGIETVASAEGRHISFAEFDEEYVEKQLADVERTASSTPSFAGVAVHDYAGWRALVTR